MKKILNSLVFLGILLAPLHYVQAIPNLQILTPNGGQAFKHGDPIMVTWNSIDINSVLTLEFIIDLNSGFTTSRTINGVYNTGSYSITPSSEWTPSDKYKIRLSANPTGTLYSDTSDGYFTIARTDGTVDTVTTDQPHAAGTNVKGVDGTVWFIDSGSIRNPYTSAGAFLSYKFNKWENVVPTNYADQNLSLASYTPAGEQYSKPYYIHPRNGSLINDHGTIYLMTNNTRVAFTNAKTFLDMGFSFSNAIPGDTSFIHTLNPIDHAFQRHPDGTLVNDNGTIYVLKDGARWGFPNMNVFNGWGFGLNEVVTANSYDKALPLGNIVGTRSATQLNL